MKSIMQQYQQPKWNSNVRARTVMKNNKITAEEQETGKLGKLCSKRKACRWKWLATLSLSSGRHEYITRYTHYVRTQLGWRYQYDFTTTDVPPTQQQRCMQVAANTFQCQSVANYLSHVLQ